MRKCSSRSYLLKEYTIYYIVYSKIFAGNKFGRRPEFVHVFTLSRTENNKVQTQKRTRLETGRGSPAGLRDRLPEAWYSKSNKHSSNT